jgi:hypothetical protein
MKRTFIFVLSLCFFLPLACKIASAQNEQKDEEVILQDVDVKDGDTLWGIANYYLKDPRAWDQILKYNKVLSNDPNVVLPGMKLRIPVKLIKESLRAANLIELLNDVRYKRKDALNWQNAELNMKFFNEDELRTMQESRATVKFLTGELIKVDQNSLIKLNPDKKQEEVRLFSGAVRASKARVLTERTEVAPKIDPKSPNPDYKTKVKDDKTTLVQVYDGVVDVTAEGKTVTLTKGFGTVVKYLNPPSAPRLLPPEPEFKASDMNTRSTLNLNMGALDKSEVSSDSDQAKSISMWQITEYHLQISPDSEFGSVLIDNTSKFKNTIDIDKNKFNLKDGTYYYRVALVNELGFESKFSPAEKFVIDSVPPVLELYHPLENEKVTAKEAVVSGRTEPKATLLVDNDTVTADAAGNFSYPCPAKRGLNHISVTARDAAGNITKIERTFYKIGGPDAKPGELTVGSGSGSTPRWIDTAISRLTTVATVVVIAIVLSILFR